MDQVKIGKFIAELRKANHLTQQELGDKIGVTNKTISRWETGNYMPDIEMLQILSHEFHVSINELLSGQKLDDEDFRKSADKNIVAVSKQSAFSFSEKKQFWIKKWRKEHVWLFVLMAIIDIVFIYGCVASEKTYLLGLLGIVFIIEYGWQNNTMMTYVENHLYGDRIAK